MKDSCRTVAGQLGKKINTTRNKIPGFVSASVEMASKEKYKEISGKDAKIGAREMLREAAAAAAADAGDAKRCYLVGASSTTDILTL